ncbi:unnamed protein product [Mycena citricolor]|uniref:Secreted protein n=1 Tax=Mycena citricolor TaxID=2018698 RepID=A0AAD2Q1K5_9AGAR|nr:unnamed protein product [Mycena citricolor]
MSDLSTWVSMMSGWLFCLPSFASLSASSFPCIPAWPLTHVNLVRALRFRIFVMVSFARSPFAARKKPWSSHFWRLLISIVSLIASISAIWLDGPSSFGTFIALFSRSSSSK